MTSTRKRLTAVLAVGAGLLIAAPAEADAQTSPQPADLVPQLDLPDPPPITLPPLPSLFPPPGTGLIDDVLNPRLP